MGSPKTIQRLNKIVARLFRILGPLAESPKPVMWDRNGEFLKLGNQKPGLLELIYRDLPQSTRVQFMLPTEELMPEPTEKEFRAFEHQFMVTARRVIHREISMRLGKAPYKPKRGRGRLPREEKIATIKLVQQVVRKHKEAGNSKTKAVENAATELGKHVDTIWRYLRAGSPASRRTKSKSQP